MQSKSSWFHRCTCRPPFRHGIYSVFDRLNCLIGHHGPSPSIREYLLSCICMRFPTFGCRCDGDSVIRVLVRQFAAPWGSLVQLDGTSWRLFKLHAVFLIKWMMYKHMYLYMAKTIRTVNLGRETRVRGIDWYLGSFSSRTYSPYTQDDHMPCHSTKILFEIVCIVI